MFGNRQPDVTHDYGPGLRKWGHDYTIMGIHDGGKRLNVSGWGDGLREGHYILLQQGDGSTRYLIKEVSYYSDPDDMWKAVLIFAPRKQRIQNAAPGHGEDGS